MKSLFNRKHNNYISTPDWFENVDIGQQDLTKKKISDSNIVMSSSFIDFKTLPIDNNTIVWNEELLSVPIDNVTIVKENGLLGVPIDNDKLKIVNGKLTVSYTEEDTGGFVTIKNYQEIEDVKNFKKGIQINGITLENSLEDVIFINSNLVVRGGIVMYADNGDIDIPDIYAGLPIDDNTLKWIENVDDKGNIIKKLGVNPNIKLGGASNWNELEGKPTWITTNKPKWDYETDIDNKPDLSIYATYDYVDDTFIPIEGDTDVLGMKNFKKGLKIDGLGITKSQDDVIYLDANLVVRGGITMYAEGTVNIPSIIESIPTATNHRKGLASFDAEFFTVDAAGHVTLIPENVGLNEEELGIYLTENKYATQDWITSKSYAKNDDLLFLKARIDDFLEGSDTDTIINKWKELESFLSGLSESDNLATILGTKANQSDLDDTNDVVATKWTQDDIKIGNWDTAYKWGDHSKVGYALKSYVDDTFVTLATKQTITGEKDFTGGLKVNGSPIVYDATNKYWKLEGDLLVTGGVTMYASDSAFTPSTIMDAIATDNVNLKVIDGVLTFVGKTGGGVADSVLWDNVEGKPSWIGSSKPSYSYSEISGTPTLLSSFYNDVGFIDSGALSGYMPLSGGQMTGSISFLGNHYLYGNVAHPMLSDANGFLSVYHTDKATILGAYGDGTTPNIATYIRSTGNNLYHRQGNNNAYKDYRIWDEGNDGAGSGLDADLLDGVQLSGLLTSMTYTAMKADGTMPSISTVVGGVTKSISLGYEGLVRKGYAYCSIVLDSYWVKIASITLPYNYDDYAATLCVECPFNSGEGSYIVKWACRTNGTTTEAPSSSVRILGSTHHDFRVYNSGAGSTTTFELWANLRERYGGIAYTVIQESDRDSVNKSVLATYYNTNFTTVQTPTLTNWVAHTFDSIGNNSASATKLQTPRTIWGQSFDGSANVTGNLTVGDGNLILNNNKLICTLDANGNNTELIRMNGNPDLIIGTGIANTGYGVTYIRGGHIRLQYGSSYTNGLMLNSVGNVLIGTTTDSGYKLDVNGTLRATGDTTLATKLTLNGIPIYKSQDDVLYIDGNLAVRGGITMYATDAIDVPSIIEALPPASSSAKGIASFNPNDFSVVDGYVSFIGKGGVDESVLADYAKKTDLSNYLPLSGGVIEGALDVCSNDNYGIIRVGGKTTENYAVIDNYSPHGRGALLSAYDRTDNWVGGIGIMNTGAPYYLTSSGSHYILLHSGNWSQFVTAGDGGNYLPLTGGTLNGQLRVETSGDLIALKSSLSYATIAYSCKNGATWSLGCNNESQFQFWNNAIGAKISYLDVEGSMWYLGNRTDNLRLKIGVNGIVFYGSNAVDTVPTFAAVLGNGAYVGELASCFMSPTQFNYYYYGGTYTDNGITISKSKYIGMGTTSPLYKLDVRAASNHVLLVKSTSSNEASILYENNSGHLWIGGNVGDMFFLYSNTAGAIRFSVDTSGNTLSYGGITMYSDIRKKTKLKDVELTLQQIAEAPLIEHYYNSDSNKTTHVGSIAQYWAGLNDWFCKLDNEGYYTMEVQNAALASAISIARELVKYESKTDRKIRLLKQRVKELEDKIEKLENN